MDKTLENAFFKIYAGHTVELLTQWLEYEYAIAKGETFSPFVKNMYLSTLSMIEHAVQKEKFLDLSIEDGKWQINCIIDEIEENLKSCDNDSAKERYLIYILKPFGRLSKYYRLDQYLLFMQESVRMVDEALKEGGNIQGEVKIILNKYEEVTYKYDLLVGIRQTGKLGVMESQMSDTEKMKLCITKLLIYFDTYAYELKRMLQVYGISLEALQERTGIYIHPINQTGEKHRNAIKENKIETSLTDSNMENMNTVDALIEKIDNELIILHDAPNVGEYKVFDFKTALSKLGAEMKKSECSEYHKEKISNLIIVFNDLCNTIIETTFYRDLSYDAESHIAKTEVIVSNTIKQNNTTTILEQEIPEELWKYYSQKSLPEQFSKTVSEICKYDYFKRKCKNDYSSFFPATQYHFDGDLNTVDDLVSCILVSGDLIQKGDRFEEFFNIDINFVWKHKTSFENYVYQLKKEKALMAKDGENKRSSIKDSSQYECARASNTVILPDSLNTNRAQEYFAKAIALGYLEKTERGYKSKFASKSLLAYFLELVYCRNEQGKDNAKSFPETELNRLLNESRLGKARGQYLGNTGGKPKGHKAIDDIFNLRS